MKSKIGNPSAVTGDKVSSFIDIVMKTLRRDFNPEVLNATKKLAKALNTPTISGMYTKRDIDRFCEILNITPEELYEEYRAYDYIESHIDFVRELFIEIASVNKEVFGSEDYSEKFPHYVTEESYEQLLEIIKSSISSFKYDIFVKLWGIRREAVPKWKIAERLGVEKRLIDLLEREILKDLGNSITAEKLIAWYKGDFETLEALKDEKPKMTPWHKDPIRNLFERNNHAPKATKRKAESRNLKHTAKHFHFEEYKNLCNGNYFYGITLRLKRPPFCCGTSIPRR